MSVRDEPILYLRTGKGTTGGTVAGGNAITTTRVHKLDGAEHQAADDTTRLDASTTAHGLLPKLSGVLTEFLNGEGEFTVPAGGSGLGWFNVVTYGAVGDGLTDDTAACQDAIDAASSAGGGIVYFPAGHYLLSTTTSGARYGLTVPSNVSLEGDGYASYLELTNAGNAGTVQAVIELGGASTSASHITIRGLRVDGNHSTLNGGTKYIQGIHARQDGDTSKHVDHVVVEDCTVVDTNVAIVCSKGGATASGSGRTASRHLDWTVRNNLVDTTTNKAIELQECLVGEIVDNRAYAATDAFQAINYSERIRIARNYGEYTNAGISVTEGCIDVDVHDNTVYSTSSSGSIGAAGIILRREPFASAVNSYRIRVRNNTVICTDSGGYLFAFETRTENTGVSNWEDVEISGNVFKGAGNSYLYDKASATRSSATGLKIRDNFFIGPALTHASWSSSGTRVERNRFNTAHTANTDGWRYEQNHFISTFTVVGSITQGPTSIGGVEVSGTAVSGYVPVASSSTAATWAAVTAGQYRGWLFSASGGTLTILTAADGTPLTGLMDLE